MPHPLQQIEKALGITISLDDNLLESVFTHASCGKKTNYERLEFLGDRVLGLMVADILYTLYPTSSEGGLAKRFSLLVSTQTLAKICQQIELDHLIQMKGNAITTAVRADVTEAFIGFLYLRFGLKSVEKFIQEFWHDQAAQMKEVPIDPRSQLQERTMKLQLDPPQYRLLHKSGTDHAPEFTFEVLAFKQQGIGKGSNKQAAKAEAAKDLLAKIIIDKEK